MEALLLFYLGMICILLKKGTIRNKISLLILYIYLYIMFEYVVGMPTLKELLRICSFQESIFHPCIELTLLSEGLSRGFYLNIIMFIPFGFLCPIISHDDSIFYNLFLGAGLSLFIEISQLFTLYRVSDINDFISNVLGAFIGYLCFYIFKNLNLIKEEELKKYLPIIMIVFTFVIVFFS